MQMQIPHATTPGLVATTTVEPQEAVNAGGLQATIKANAHFTNFIQGTETYPTLRNNLQGAGGLTATGSNT